MAETNRQLVLRQRPNGLITDADYELIDVPIPALQPGEVLIRTSMLSMEAGVRRIFDMMPFATALPCWGAGVVVESRADAIPVRSNVAGFLWWQDYTVANAEWMTLPVPTGTDPATMLFPIGASGMTAYFGLFHDGAPRTGDVVVVSGAAGGVGSLAGQFARIQGCRTIAITGGAEKAQWLVDELGFEAAIDHHHQDVDEALARLCPDGVDVYFDNVGGSICHTVSTHMRPGGRLVRCGFTSEHLTPGVSHLPSFYTMAYAIFFATATKAILGWIADGQLRCEYTTIDGLERSPQGLNMLYAGHSKGKVLVKLTDEVATGPSFWLWGTAPRAVGRVHPATLWGDDDPRLAGNDLHRWGSAPAPAP